MSRDDDAPSGKRDQIKFAGSFDGDLQRTARTLAFVEALAPVAEALGDRYGEDAMLAGLLTATINLGLERYGIASTEAALRNALDRLREAVAAREIAAAGDIHAAGRA